MNYKRLERTFIVFLIVFCAALVGYSIVKADQNRVETPKSFLVQVGEPTSKDSRCILASVLIPSDTNFSNRTEIRFENSAVKDCKELTDDDSKTAIVYAEESNVTALASK